MMTTCTQCGKTISGRSRYCAYCGARVPSLPVQAIRRFDWRLLGYWLVASLFFAALAWVLLTHPLVAGLIPASVSTLLQALGAGLVVAIGQWLVLRPHVRDQRWWLLALPAGWGLAFYLSGVWPRLGAQYPIVRQVGDMVVPLMALGGLAGYLQWPLARQYAWPRRHWVLASALAPAGVALVIGLLLGNGDHGGWFLQLAFRLGGQPAFSTNDLVIAGLLGLLLGVGQFFLIRRTVGAALLWPVMMAAGGVTAAAGIDGLCNVMQASVVALGRPNVTVPWTIILTGPAGVALAWAVTGIGLSGSQYLLLRWTASLPPYLQPPPLGVNGQLNRRPEMPGRLWVPLSVTGGAGGALLAWLLIPSGWLLLGAVGAGLLAGLPQWLAVRGSFKRAAWLPAVGSVTWSLMALLPTLLAAPQLWQGQLALPVFTVLLALCPGPVLALRR